MREECRKIITCSESMEETIDILSSLSTSTEMLAVDTLSIPIMKSIGETDE